mmetsp:Transcript_3940/g.6045  ORF Transcript_3940/g.6045 Transcript_3940/m.6045 type:complete len:177 (-) Transcript_3940:166-696(-)
MPPRKTVRFKLGGRYNCNEYFGRISSPDDPKKALLRVGQWAAVEDPDENPFWLAKIAEKAYQHTGNSIEATKTDIAFVKNYWYIKVHVYKPKVSQAPGGYSFKWAQNPHAYGAGVSVWTVDAESVFSILQTAPEGDHQRRSSRSNTAGHDAYEAKKITLEAFEKIKADYSGKLSYM